MSEVAAIILAAGASTRLGRPKQLVRYQGQTLLTRTIVAAREAGCAPIIAVLGAHAEACRAEAGDAHIVINHEWETGMASSLRAGLQAVPEVEAAILLVCDQPYLTGAHLTAILEKWRATRAQIVCSEYDRKRGVPALFPRAHFSALMALTGDQGARRLLRFSGVLTVPWEAGSLDLDSASDLQALGSGLT